MKRTLQYFTVGGYVKLTYTEAANNPVNSSQKWLFKDPKKSADGRNERWCILNDGSIAHLKVGNAQHILVSVPVQSLKHEYRLCLRELTDDEWRCARKRFKEEYINE